MKRQRGITVREDQANCVGGTVECSLICLVIEVKVQSALK